MNITEIRRLVKLVESSGIHELEIEEEGLRVRIARNSPPQILAASPIVGPAVAEPNAATPAPAPVPPLAEAESSPAAESLVERTVDIKSPMVGTFYRAPSPEAPPYVKVGDNVKSGQELCIIEAMKLMNEIESEVSGEIVEIAVDNAQPVEFDQVLFRIKPA